MAKQYLESDYLVERYLYNVADPKNVGAQWTVRIDADKALAAQYAAQMVDKQKLLGAQWQGHILDYKNERGLQYQVVITKELSVGTQWHVTVLDYKKPTGLAWITKNTKQVEIATQYAARIVDFAKAGGVGWNFQFIGEEKNVGVQYLVNNTKQIDIPLQWTTQIDSQENIGSQWHATINDFKRNAGVGWQTKVLETPKAIGLFYKSTHLVFRQVAGYLELPYLTTAYLGGVQSLAAPLQWHVVVEDRIKPHGVQWITQIDSKKAYGLGWITQIDYAKNAGVQYAVKNTQTDDNGLQWQGKIVDAVKTSGIGWLTRIDASRNTGAQWVVSAANKTGVQWRVIVYNTNRPRAMYQFASRGTGSEVREVVNVARSSNVVTIVVDAAHGYTVGQLVTVRAKNHPELSGEFTVSQTPTPTTFRYTLAGANIASVADTGDVRGHNWTASNTRIGDFAASNVNTDIVEQAWRTQDNILTATMDCDTQVPQGVFMDTLAILNHNFTRSVNILVQASNTAGNFSSPLIEIYIPWNKTNIYWVAPQLPNIQARYWRFRFENLGNPDNYLQVGTIVFGSSVIFSKECFVNPIKYGRVAFADSVQTEGFTNVSNDRAVKNYVEMTFKNLDYSQGNYHALVEMFDTVRTTHKTLWIPEPRYPNRYGVFGKLTELPEESHNDLGEDSDWVDMAFKIDESL